MSDIQHISPDRVARFGRSGFSPVIALGLTELLLLAALGWVPGLRSTPLPSVALWALAFTTYAAAARLQQGEAATGARAVWAIGLGMRLLLLPLLPYYSDDIYRYLWDGWVQTHDVNPYLYAPADPALETLRTSWHGLINHPTVSTIYPPAAQVVFLALARIAPAIGLFKAAWVLLDLGVAWVVGRLAGTGRRVALLLYLWSPLLVLEVAWSGHLEPLGLLPMMAGLLVLGGAARTGARRGLAGGLLLGLGAGVKFAPAAAFPALLRRHGLVALLAAVSLPVLLYVPYAGAGEGLFSGLELYAETWAFHAGPYNLLARLVDSLPGSFVSPRQVALAIVLTCAVYAALRRWPVQRTLFWTIGVALLVSPTLHPWYVLWILPFAILANSRGWLLFSGTVFLAYWGRDAYHETGVWAQPGWLTALIWLPLVILLAVDGLRAQRLPRGRQVAGREQSGERHGG